MTTRRKASVSLCMIVRNEEANLAECLTPVAALFDEIVIVDTGSEDRTREIAARFTKNVHEFEWCDDFSAARNESLRHASGDWVFWLDADDRLSNANIVKLGALLEGLDDRRRVYMMETVLPSQDVCLEASLVAHPRLFRRHPDLRWRGRVHEQLRTDEVEAKYEAVASAVQIDHVGYLDAAVCHRKQFRKLRLLRMEYAVNPDDPSALFHLGLAYALIRNFGEARKHLLRLVNMRHECLATPRIYITLAEMSLTEGNFPEALQHIELGLARLPGNEHLRYLQAQIYCQVLQLDAAVEVLRDIIMGNSPSSLHGFELRNIRDKVAPRLLADVLRMQGRLSAAAMLLQPLLVAFPDDTLSWYVLGLTAIDAGDRQHLEMAVGGLTACRQGDLHGRLLKARWYVRSMELEAAGELIDGLVAEVPQSALPRMLRAEWLSRSGAPLAAQIQAIRDVLRIQPHNGEAVQWLRSLEDRQQTARLTAERDLWTSVIMLPGATVG